MILWIDPGVRKLGYALIDWALKIHDSGILLQKKNCSHEERSIWKDASD